MDVGSLLCVSPSRTLYRKKRCFESRRRLVTHCLLVFRESFQESLKEKTTFLSRDVGSVPFVVLFFVSYFQDSLKEKTGWEGTGAGYEDVRVGFYRVSLAFYAWFSLSGSENA